MWVEQNCYDASFNYNCFVLIVMVNQKSIQVFLNTSCFSVVCKKGETSFSLFMFSLTLYVFSTKEKLFTIWTEMCLNMNRKKRNTCSTIFIPSEIIYWTVTDVKFNWCSVIRTKIHASIYYCMSCNKIILLHVSTRLFSNNIFRCYINTEKSADNNDGKHSNIHI